MKKPVKIIAGTVVALVVLALVAPFLIPMGSYKAEIIRQVKIATGRDLSINGPIRLTLLRGVGLHLERVSLSNPKGYATPLMISVEDATVHVALMPLLSHRVEVTKLILEKPAIDLEVSAQGVPNWRFTPPDQVPEAPTRHSALPELIASANAASPSPVAVPAPAPAPAVSPSASILDTMQRLRLGDVEISGGMLRYIDLPGKKKYTMQAINLHMAMNGPDVPFTLAGDMQFNGQKTTFDVNVNTPQSLLSGGGATLRVNLDAPAVQLAMDTKASVLGANGDIKLNVLSLPGVAAWVNGTPAAWKGSTPLALSVKGKLACTPVQCVADNADIHLDNITLDGKVGVAWAAAVPYVVAALHTDALDLTPYMAQPAKGKGHALNVPFAIVADAEAARPAPPPAGWSVAPIDLSGLHAANADVQITAAKVMAQQIQLGQSSFSASLKDSVLQLSIPSMVLYNGQGKADITLDGRTTMPQVSVKAELHGVQAEPLLKDAENFDRLSGTMEFTLAATGHGINQKDIIGTLSGNGKIALTNGAVKGVDLGNMVQSVQGLLGVPKPASNTPQQQTAFSELSGNYTIAQGIVHNSDLALKSAVLQAKGAGDVDLPKRFVNYRVEPQLASAPQPAQKGQQGQAAGKSQQGLVVPIVVAGPFENVTFRPDVNAVAQNALKNPDAIKNTAKSVKDQIKKSGGVKNLLNGLR